MYPPLQHAEWHGWTLTDVVFPSFLWIVGVAITLSLAKRAGRRRIATRSCSHRYCRRAVILYVLGLLLYGFPDFDLGTQRLLGVLQRIAICYLIASAIYLTTRVRGQILWIAGPARRLLADHDAVPVPGYGAGHLDVEGNFAHYVDRMFLGRHNYAWTKTWDPEGIVSTLPAIATALFGMLAGQILRIKRELSERTTWLFLTGNCLLAAGLICNVWLPINKKLWTSSFSLFMAGLDFVIFAVFVWLIDGKGYQRAVKPLVIMGMNAIAIYMASELGDVILDMIRWNTGTAVITLRTWLYQALFAPFASPINASLAYAIAYTLLMWVIAYVMYRRKWFLRV